jgi:hypothetical protein
MWIMYQNLNSSGIHGFQFHHVHKQRANWPYSQYCRRGNCMWVGKPALKSILPISSFLQSQELILMCPDKCVTALSFTAFSMDCHKFHNNMHKWQMTNLQDLNCTAQDWLGLLKEHVQSVLQKANRKIPYQDCSKRLFLDKMECG